MGVILEEWNRAENQAATEALLHCCAARRWAGGVAAQRPLADENALLAAADAVWGIMEEPDWLEAFRAHPRIGERKPAQASAQSVQWSSQEQAAVHDSEAHVLEQLTVENQRYEELFGFTYIVCATGKSADEMLQILRRRLTHGRATELVEAAEQQRQILQIRLRKWLLV